MKIAFQSLQDPGLAGLIATSKAGGHKSINDPAILQIFPTNWIKTCRMQTTAEAACGGLNPNNASAQKVVDLYMAAAAPAFSAAPLDTYFEGPYNEPGGLEDPVFMKWLGDIEYLRMKAMDQIGRRAVIFNASSQANVADKLGPWKQALQYCHDHGHAYGTHGYTSPKITDHPELLYNHVPVMQALGFKCDTIYTEGPIDAILGLNNYSGWRLCMSQAQLIAAVEAWDQSLMQYPEVLIAYYYVWTWQTGNPDYTMYNLVMGNPRQETRASGDILIDYLAGHPWVGRQVPAPVPTPVPTPAPIPVPTVGPNLVKNPNMTGDTYAVKGNPNQQHVPVEWTPINTQDQIEQEFDPFNVPPGQRCTGRVYQSYTTRRMGLSQGLPVEQGATYRINWIVKGWCTTDPVPHTKSTSPMQLQLRVGGPDVAPVVSTIMDQFVVITQDVVAPGPSLYIEIAALPQFAVYRSDFFSSLVEVRKIAPAPTPEPTPKPVQPPLPGFVGTARAITPLNVRSGPSTSYSVLRVLAVDEPVECDGTQQAGFAELSGLLNLTGDINDGVKPVKAWASAQYLNTQGG